MGRSQYLSSISMHTLLLISLLAFTFSPLDLFTPNHVVGSPISLSYATCRNSQFWTDGVAAGWSPTAFASIVGCPDGKLYKTGGSGDGVLRYLVWVSSDRGNTWVAKANLPGNGTSDGTFLCGLDGKLTYVGGVNFNGMAVSSDGAMTWNYTDTYAVFGSRKFFVASLIPSSGYSDILLVGGWQIPPATQTVPTDHIGDQAAYNVLKGDAYRYFGATGQWSRLCLNCGYGARAFGAGAYANENTFLLVGGWTGSAPSNDVWKTTNDGVTWTQGQFNRDDNITISGPSWSPRQWFNAWSFNRIFYVGFGSGCSSAIGSCTGKNDVWSSADYGRTWTQVTAAISNVPQLMGASTTIVLNSIEVCAGWLSNNPTGLVNTCQWSLIGMRLDAIVFKTSVNDGSNPLTLTPRLYQGKVFNYSIVEPLTDSILPLQLNLVFSFGNIRYQLNGQTQNVILSGTDTPLNGILMGYTNTLQLITDDITYTITIGSGPPVPPIDSYYGYTPNSYTVNLPLTNLVASLSFTSSFAPSTSTYITTAVVHKSSITLTPTWSASGYTVAYSRNGAPYLAMTSGVASTITVQSGSNVITVRIIKGTITSYYEVFVPGTYSSGVILAPSTFCRQWTSQCACTNHFCGWCLVGGYCTEICNNCASGGPKLNTCGSDANQDISANMYPTGWALADSDWVEHSNWVYLDRLDGIGPWAQGAADTFTACPSGQILEGMHWETNFPNYDINQPHRSMRTWPHCVPSKYHDTTTEFVVRGPCDTSIEWVGFFDWTMRDLFRIGVAACPHTYQAITAFGLTRCGYADGTNYGTTPPNLANFPNNRQIQWVIKCVNPYATIAASNTFTTYDVVPPCVQNRPWGNSITNIGFIQELPVAYCTTGWLTSFWHFYCADQQNWIWVSRCTNPPVPKSCPMITIGANDYVSATEWTSDGSVNSGTAYQVGSILQVSCQPGYGPLDTSIGTKYITCQDTSMTWTSGSSTCAGCIVGQYSSVANFYTCDWCPDGSYNENPQQTSCINCVVNGNSRCSLPCQHCASDGTCPLKPGWCTLLNPQTSQTQCYTAITQYDSRNYPKTSDPNFLNSTLDQGCSYCFPSNNPGGWTYVNDNDLSPFQHKCRVNDTCLQGHLIPGPSVCLDCELCGGATTGCLFLSSNHCKVNSTTCGCNIGSTCYLLDAVNPLNPCQRASVRYYNDAIDRCTGDWVNDDALSCDNSTSCTYSRHCSSGSCLFLPNLPNPPCITNLTCYGNIGNGVSSYNPYSTAQLNTQSHRCYVANLTQDACQIDTYCAADLVACPATARITPVFQNNFQFGFANRSVAVTTNNLQAVVFNNETFWPMLVGNISVPCGGLQYQLSLSTDNTLVGNCRTTVSTIYQSSLTSIGNSLLNQIWSVTLNDALPFTQDLTAILQIFNMDGNFDVHCTSVTVDITSPIPGQVLSGILPTDTWTAYPNRTNLPLHWLGQAAVNSALLDHFVLRVNELTGHTTIFETTINGNAASNNYIATFNPQVNGAHVQASLITYGLNGLTATATSPIIILDVTSPAFAAASGFYHCDPTSSYSTGLNTNVSAPLVGQNSLNSLVICSFGSGFFETESPIVGYDYIVQARSAVDVSQNPWVDVQTFTRINAGDWTGTISVTGLTLVTDTIYRVGIRAINDATLISNIVYSNLVIVDTSPPQVGDVFFVQTLPAISGPTSSIDYTSSLTDLYLNWDSFINPVDASLTQWQDPGSGVALYEVSLGTAQYPASGYASVFDFRVIGSNVTVVIGHIGSLALTSGQTYYISFRARNFANLVSSVISKSIGIDATPPLLSSAFVRDVRVDPNLDVDYILYGTSFAAAWGGFSEPESRITKFYLALGSNGIVGSHVNFTDVGLTSYWQGELADLLNTTRGQTLFFTIRVVNIVGLYADINSNGFQYDIPSSTNGLVYAGTISGIDQQWQLETDRMMAVWSNFSFDPVAVASYEWGIGDCDPVNFVLSILPWTNVYLNTTATAFGLSLVPYQTYCVHVRAWSEVSSSIVASSSGTRPIPYAASAGDVNDGSIIANTQVYWQSQTTSFSANWNGFALDDPTVPIYYEVTLQQITREAGDTVGALNTTAGIQIVVPALNIGTHQLSYTWSGLQLNHTGIYRARICAVTPAPVSLSTCVNGDGVEIDSQPPICGVVYNGFSTDAHTSFQYSTVTVTASWFNFSDDVASYSWSVGTSINSSDLLPTTLVGTSVQAQATSLQYPSLQLIDGSSFYITVTATGYSGLSCTVSSPVVSVIDSSPLAGTVSSSPTGLSTSLRLVNSVQDFLAFIDGFSTTAGGSPIIQYQYAIGTTRFGTQLLSYQLLPNTTVINTLLQNYQISHGLDSDLLYYVSVLAQNSVGLTIATSSYGVQIVTSPPITPLTTPALLNPDVTSDVIQPIQFQSNPNSIRFSWQPFSDDYSTFYEEWSIGSSNTLSDINDWQVASNQRDVTVSSLTLQPNVPFFIRVRAVNAVNLTSEIYAQYAIDTALPVAGAIRVTSGRSTTVSSFQPSVSFSFCQASNNDNGVTIEWDTFTAASGMVSYDWSLSTNQPFGTDVYNWTTVGLTTEAAISSSLLNSFTLPSNRLLYVNVRGTSTAGLTSQTYTIISLVVDVDGDSVAQQISILNTNNVEMSSILNQTTITYLSTNTLTVAVVLPGVIFQAPFSLAYSIGGSPGGMQFINLRPINIFASQTTYSINETNLPFQIGGSYYLSLDFTDCSGVDHTIVSNAFIYDPLVPDVNLSQVVVVNTFLESFTNERGRSVVTQDGQPNYYIHTNELLCAEWNGLTPTISDLIYLSGGLTLNDPLTPFESRPLVAYLPLIPVYNSSQLQLCLDLSQLSLHVACPSILSWTTNSNLVHVATTPQVGCANGPELDSGTVYTLSLQATTGAGLRVLQSVELQTDGTAPTGGVVSVYNGQLDFYGSNSANSNSAECQSDLDTIYVRWNGFSEAESLLLDYQVCVSLAASASSSTTPLCEVMEWTSYELRLSAVIPITLQPDTGYIVSVLATNAVNMTRLVSGTTVTVVSTPPILPLDTADGLPAIYFSLSDDTRPTYISSPLISAHWLPWLTTSGTISSYEWSLSISPDGLQYTSGYWNPLYLNTQLQYHFTNITNDASIYVSIRATGCSGLQSVGNSLNATLDFTPPHLGTVAFLNPAPLIQNNRIHFYNTQPDTIIAFNMSDWYDLESDIAEYRWTFTTSTFSASDAFQTTQIPTRSQRLAFTNSTNANSSLFVYSMEQFNLVTIDGQSELVITNITVGFDNAGGVSWVMISLPNLIPFLPTNVNIDVTLSVKNNANLITSSVETIKVDTNAPQPGAIWFDLPGFTTSTADLFNCHSNSSHIKIHWTTFADSYSLVVNYDVALTNSSQFNDSSLVVPWSDVGLTRSFEWFGLDLIPGQPYYAWVRATNAAGLATMIQSPPILLILTQPTIPDMAVRIGLDLNVSVAYWSDASQLTFNFDPASQSELTQDVLSSLPTIVPLTSIFSYSFAIGTIAGGSQIADLTTITTANTSLQYVYDRLILPQDSNNYPLYVTLKVQNCAGFSSWSISTGTTVDRTPPLPLAWNVLPSEAPLSPYNLSLSESASNTILLSLVHSIDNPVFTTYVGNSTGFAFSFVNFIDDVSEVVDYRYAVSSGLTSSQNDPTPFGDVIPETSLGANPTQFVIQISGLNLQQGERYTISLHVENGAHLIARHQLQFEVDLTAPNLPFTGLIMDGEDGSGISQRCQSSSTIGISFSPCQDAESGITSYSWGLASSNRTIEGTDLNDLIHLLDLQPLTLIDPISLIPSSSTHLFHISNGGLQFSAGSQVYALLQCTNGAGYSSSIWSEPVIVTCETGSTAVCICDSAVQCV